MRLVLRFGKKGLEQVGTALKRLRQCAPGIDDLSKCWISPLSATLVPFMTALFSSLYAHGKTISARTLAVIVAVKKKEPSLVDMTNFRGIIMK